MDRAAWTHLRDRHGTRLTLSYLAIPPMVAAALWRNNAFSLGRWAAASSVIALLKLVATAGLMVVLTLAA
jgi:hypothetical protein